MAKSIKKGQFSAFYEDTDGPGGLDFDLLHFSLENMGQGSRSPRENAPWNEEARKAWDRVSHDVGTTSRSSPINSASDSDEAMMECLEDQQTVQPLICNDNQAAAASITLPLGTDEAYRNLSKVVDGETMDVLLRAMKLAYNGPCPWSTDGEKIPDHTWNFWSNVDLEFIKAMVRINPEFVCNLPWFTRAEDPEFCEGKDSGRIETPERYEQIMEIVEEGRRTLAVKSREKEMFEEARPWSLNPKKMCTSQESEGQPMMSNTASYYSDSTNGCQSAVIGQEVEMMRNGHGHGKNNSPFHYQTPSRLGPFPYMGNYEKMQPERLEEQSQSNRMRMMQAPPLPPHRSPFQCREQEQHFQQFQTAVNIEQDYESQMITQIPHSYQAPDHMMHQYCGNLGNHPMNNQMQPHFQHVPVTHPGYPLHPASGFSTNGVEFQGLSGQSQGCSHSGYQTSGYGTNVSNVNSGTDLENLFHETMSISSPAVNNYSLSSTVPRTPPIPLRSSSCATTRQSSPTSDSQLPRSHSSNRGDRATGNPLSFSPPARIRAYNPSQKKYEYECVFCKGNDQTEDVYKSHPIRINDTVLCPFLRKHVCGLCGATGDNAHTIKYCPYNQRGFFASRNTQSRMAQSEGYDYGSKIGISFNRSQFRSKSPELNRQKQPVVRRLNFDVANTSKTNNVFFKNLQQLHNGNKKPDSVHRYI